MTTESTCPSCGAGVGASFYELPAIPTNSCLLINDRMRRSTFRSLPCGCPAARDCGFIFNGSLGGVAHGLFGGV